MYKKGLLLFLFVFVVISCNSNIKNWTYKGEEVLLYVDDEPIVSSEFDFFNQKVRTNVISYYKKKYTLKTVQDFWNQTYGNEQPKETLKQFALDATIENKIQNIILKEYGIRDTIDFHSFRESLKKENERRKDLLDKGGIIYGPKQYSKQVYYNYLLSNAILTLKNQVASTIANLDKLKSKYNRIKDTVFNKKPDVTVGLLSVPYGHSTPYTQDEALTVIKKIKKRITSVQDFEQGLNSFDGIKGVQVLDKHTLKSEQSRTDGEMFGSLYRYMERLKKGEVTSILDINQKLSILVCYDKIEKGYMSFEEAKPQLEGMVMDEWFSNLVSKRKQETKIIKKEGF